MGNVWDAMKKHNRETRPPANTRESPPAPAPASPDRAPVADALETAPETPASEPKGPRRLATRAQLNGYDRTLVAHYDRGGRLTEDYRALRTNLLAQYRKGRFCLMLISSEAGEGKTVTCLNLALVMAEMPDRRTVVVDLDIRKGQASRMMKVSRDRGAADVLRGEAAVADVIKPTTYPNLSIVPAGRANRAEIGELFGQTDLDEMLGELRRRFDYVLIDTPPVAGFSDAGMIGRSVNDALVVVRMNKTHRESVDKAIRLLHAANVNPVGVVLTHQRYYIPDYLYRYS